MENSNDWWTTERGLLPNLIRREKVQQKTPFIVLANPEGIVYEFTHADIENASNRAAWLLEKTLAPDEEKVLYMGRMDLRYLIWAIAAMKAGKCVILPSPSNTVGANQLLFHDVAAKTLLFSPESFDMLEALHSATKDDLRWVETPKFDDLMSRETADVFPFEHTFEQVRDKRFLGLHTSGTTGHPKPIYWTHSAIPIFASQSDRSLRADDSPEETIYQQVFGANKRTALMFPFYHAGGMLSLMGSIVSGALTVTAPVPGMRLTPENVTGFLRVTRPNVGIFPPSVLENMLKQPDAMEELSRLEHVGYGGGPMNPAAGEKLAQTIPHLMTMIGSTEGGFFHMETTNDSAHWNSFNFPQLGHRMEEVEPGLFELVFPRTELIDKTYLFFHSYPDLTEYRTKDMFSPAEGQPGWWVYRGRADNWIAMSNGLKFDPKGTEDTIGGHPDVDAVIVAGGRRFRLCLLIELDPKCYPAQGFQSPQDEREWRQRMVEKVWPVIEEANHKAPKFGRIPKELILFSAKDEPFARAPKGSIQRQLTLARYEERIDRMYTESEQGLLTQGLLGLESTTTKDFVPFLRHLYAQTLELKDIGPDDDVFAHGMDSFAIATVSSRLKAALRAKGVSEAKLNDINIRLIYEKPTATQMAQKLDSMLNETSNGDNSPDDAFNVVALLDKYEAEVRKLFENQSSQNGLNGTVTNGHSQGHVVAVTGTTGSMGSYLLATLLARTDVAKVICLNRASDAMDKQAVALRSRGLSGLETAVEQGRVVFMNINVAAPRLGLTDGEYATLVHETTSIIHNAFPVNFLMTVQQFEPQFVGMLNLLEVVRIGKRHPSFLVVSSVSAAASSVPRDVVPEVILDHDEVKHLAMEGYGSAKFICERMTHVFAQESAKIGTPAATGVLRVGQVAGPLTGSGKWNVWEWLPSIIVSSKFLGAAPDGIGFWTNGVDFVPVDALGNIMSELIDALEKHRSEPNGSETVVYNVVNPQVTTWGELLPALKRAAPQVVPLREWVGRLEATKDTSAQILDQNPGVKLLDFYKSFLGGEEGSGLKFATDKLVLGSKTAADLGPITPKQMDRWINGWGL
ncbi:putative NRPS-like protein biosynthetic cluster [Gnomoniopsis sp. IMI 355080]|nr:putative NRPS-like protein biosynthetic cluster [Gnomoniopsis sp. IMI 355080]